MTRDSESPNRETPEARQMITNSNFRASKCLYTPLHRKAKITKRQGDRWSISPRLPCLSHYSECSGGSAVSRTVASLTWLHDVGHLVQLSRSEISALGPWTPTCVPPVPNLPVRLFWFPNWPHSCLVACRSPTFPATPKYWVGQKCRLRFSIRWYGKTRRTFLGNPICSHLCFFLF